MLNLIVERVFSVLSRESGLVTANIPDIYLMACQDNIESFQSLRPHQWQAWHCFLAQLAALALLRAGESTLPSSAARWAELLRGLTPEWADDQPWQLVVDDWQQPAFLQFPTPAGSEAQYKKTLPTSDQLDMLLTSKNHDLKTGAALHSTAENWVYALINLQTTEGFLGAGNYGISRMNGGFSSRCFMGLAPQGGLGAHLCRDIQALLRGREELCETYSAIYPSPDNGMGILWCAPWDGLSSLDTAALDPYYIDTCRRVRLSQSSDRLVAKTANSQSARIAAKELNGNTGDPWAPVQQADPPKAVTLDASGFHYRRVTDLLFGDWTQPLMCQAAPDEKKQDMQLVCSDFVRGQGITEGLHQRRIPFSEALMRGLFGAKRESLGLLAKSQIEHAAFVQKTLRTAVAVISAAGAGYETGRVDLKSLSDQDRSRAKTTEKHFEHYVDEHFFAPLNTAWTAEGESRETLNRQWVEELILRARVLLKEAEHAVPCPQIHRRRAIAAAHTYFNGMLFSKYEWLSDKVQLITEKELT